MARVLFPPGVPVASPRKGPSGRVRPGDSTSYWTSPGASALRADSDSLVYPIQDRLSRSGTPGRRFRHIRDDPPGAQAGVADAAVVVGRAHRAPCLRPATPAVRPRLRGVDRAGGSLGSEVAALPPLAADPARSERDRRRDRARVPRHARADGRRATTRVDGTRCPPARAAPRRREPARIAERGVRRTERADQSLPFSAPADPVPAVERAGRPTSIVSGPPATPC